MSPAADSVVQVGMATSPSIVNVDVVLDTARISSVSLIVALCAGAILVLDGLDIQVIGMAAPDLVQDFGIQSEALAPALAAALVGMAIGASLVGAMGDRWGRRPALLLSTFLFGAATLLAATSRNVTELAVWRLITGIGLGGALPTATALLAEFTSQRARSQAIGVALVGVPLGGILGASLAADLVPEHGWRAIFIVGGVLPMLAASLMYFVMPESPRFLATRAHRPAALATLLNKIEGRERYSSEHSFVLGADSGSGRHSGVRALFAPQLRWDTTLTSLAFLTNIFAVYAFFNWSPLVLTSMGFGFEQAVRSTLAFNIAGIVGSLVIAVTIARFGSRIPLSVSALTAALALVGLACLQSHDPSSLMAGIASAGATISAVQVGMYAVAANVFPTPCRSSGIGWALGAGRLGGILSAFAGGALLAIAGGRGFFGGVGAVMLLTLATILLLRRHVPRPQTQTDPGEC
jgi:MFS transporter, AAHS family, 4-hydroxybenzoate transporter